MRITPNGPVVPNPPTPDVAYLADWLRRLHSPAVVCRGCCAVGCGGDCEWSDAYDGELVAVCSHCCLDAGTRNWICLGSHGHGAESGPSAICATVAILDGDYDADPAPWA